MTTTSKYDLKRARFEFTKSQTAGHYNMRNPRNSFLSLADATPEKIAKLFSNRMIETLNSMDRNQATEIIIECIWK